jgi:glycerophosphoryl diester phosphodiesterase
VTDERIVTLEEMLVRARGRILLNLDVKAAIYAEVVHEVVRLGASREVIVKAEAGIGSPALAAIPPYDRVPMMPILSNASPDIAAVLEQQFQGAKPVAFELPRMSAEQLPAIVAAAKKHGVRLFANTLGTGFISGYGSDADGARNPAQVWGRLLNAGVTIFQTDEPEALITLRTKR